MRLLVCSSLTKRGAGNVPLAKSVSQGVYSSEPGLSWRAQNSFVFSWDTVLPHVLKSNRLHGLFRALHGQVTNEV